MHPGKYWWQHVGCISLAGLRTTHLCPPGRVTPALPLEEQVQGVWRSGVEVFGHDFTLAKPSPQDTSLLSWAEMISRKHGSPKQVVSASNHEVMSGR